MKRTFTVTVDLPQGVDVVMMAEYIHKAVSCWTGGMDPEHPLGCIDIAPVVMCKVSGVPFKIAGRSLEAALAPEQK